MKDGFVKIGAASPEIRVADCKFNSESIISCIKEAYSKGVRLLVLPELCVTGSTCGDLFSHSVLLNGAWEAVERIACETAALDMVSVVGAPVRRNGKVYDCGVVISKGEILEIIPKRSPLANDDITGARYFEGEEYPVAFMCSQLPDLAFAVEIGSDLYSPVPPSAELALSGASIILNPSAMYEIAGRAEYRRDTLEQQSKRLLCAYACAEAGEGESTTDFVFGGQKLIAENGRILSEGKLFESGLVTADIDLGRLSFERRKNPSFRPSDKVRVCSFDLDIKDTALEREFSKSPFIPQEKKLRDERCGNVLKMQASGLKKRISHTHAETAVIGISGGLDSCLALIVAAEAMDMLGRPRKDILAVTMPCFGTTVRTRSNAEILCERLGVSFKEIDIAESVKCHFRDIGHDSDNYNVVYENSQARERTQILMDVANCCNGIVVGTGDLSELALGWATYNGDHMSMYGVNGSVPKTLVRHIVGYYSEICGDEQLSEVLRDILDTPVSPELLPSEGGKIAQKTEDLVGPYELHDFFLYYIVRFGYSPRKLFRIALKTFGEDYDRETILKWLKTFYRRFFNQQFKRSCLPDGVKVGSVGLSPRGDWKMPSDAVYTLWAEELEAL